MIASERTKKVLHSYRQCRLLEKGKARKPERIHRNYQMFVKMKTSTGVRGI